MSIGFKSLARNFAAGLVASCLAACGGPGGGGVVGSAAPAVTLPTVHGPVVSSAGFRGHVLVLDFWATWCPSCRQALEHLRRLAAEPTLHRRGLVILSIDERENAADVREFVGPTPFPFPILLDADGSVGRQYGAGLLPTVVVIGRDGLVRQIIAGYDAQTPGQLDAAIIQAFDQKL